MSVFWDWALDAYARPGVAEACLDLQDSHGQNVPLLLWAAWAAAHGQRIDSEAAGQGAALARDWQAIIVPLRDVRRTLKGPVSDGDAAVRLPLRAQVKAAELAAEQALMTQLEGLATGAGGPLPDAIAATVMLDALLAVSAAWADNRPIDALAALSARLYAKV